jgi:hypothetical protein
MRVIYFSLLVTGTHVKSDLCQETRRKQWCALYKCPLQMTTGLWQSYPRTKIREQGEASQFASPFVKAGIALDHPFQRIVGRYKPPLRGL